MNPTDRVEIFYENYRGEQGHRIIVPKSVSFTSSRWHPEPQWILDAFDVSKGEMRSFAIRDITEWRPVYELPEIDPKLTWNDVWAELEPKDEARAHLITQEVLMWRALAKYGKWPTKADFDWICERRGFDDAEREMVSRGLKAVGLWPLRDETGCRMRSGRKMKATKRARKKPISPIVRDDPE